MKTKILILLLTSFLFISCNEDDNPFTLPDATQIGANTAGCYIDGDLYVLKNVVKNNSWLGGSKTIGLKYQYNEKSNFWTIYIYMNLENSREQENSITFILKSNEEIKEGTYNLTDYKHNKDETNFALLDKARTYKNSGKLNITKIEINNSYTSISGKFNFKAIDNNNLDNTIVVSNGRFDLKIPKK